MARGMLVETGRCLAGGIALDFRIVVAVDWSGAADPSSQRRAIWLAELRDGAFERVRAGFTRNEVVEELLGSLRGDPDLVVGLDFGFSYPAAALDRLGVDVAPQLWDLVGRGAADAWLDGADVSRDYPLRELLGTDGAFRRTEEDLTEPFPWARPRSTIDLSVRTGNVGRQSLRGFPCLTRLRSGGFNVWPFDPLEPPAIVEIYPRTLRSAVIGTSRDVGRREVVAALDDDPQAPSWVVELAAADPNAFDAAVSALALWRGARRRPAARERIHLREGRIWLPDDVVVSSKTP